MKNRSWFPLDLPLLFKACGDRGIQTGSGRTITISSKGVRAYISDDPPTVDQDIELSILWPALLHGKVGIQLVMAGTVIRRKGRVIEIKSSKHEFRTQARAAAAQAG